jgi:hypothetical protein
LELISSDTYDPYSDPYDRGFYYDPNIGIRRFSIEVYGDFSELSNEKEEKPKRKKEKPKIATTKDLEEYLEQHSYIFRAYHIIKQYNEYALFLDRGLRYKAYRNKAKFHSYIKAIPKKWLKVKGKKSNHIVLTIKTKSHKELSLDEAFNYITKYFEKIKKYLNKKYGVKGYIGVLEVHSSGYPHLHVIFFLKKPAKVFKWKGIWRFQEKRTWEKELKAEERGYIDAFALKSREEFISYMTKYMAKQLKGGLVYNSDGSINLKAATLAILRIFRKHMIIASKSIKEMAKRLEAEAAKAKARSDGKCDIYIASRGGVERSQHNTTHNTYHNTTQHTTLEAMLEAKARPRPKAKAIIVLGYAEIGLWDRSPRIN